MNRIHSLDSLKLIAIIAVFVIHYGIFNSFAGIEHNAIYLSFNILARFAVPVFFVIAGYLFFQRTLHKPLTSYTQAYLVKIFMMYLVWTFIYHLVFGLSVGVWNPINFGSTLYYGTAGFEILWFLPALFYSILLLAVAQQFNKTGSLFIVATLLHLIGLANQSYQPLLPESLQFSETNFRDPAFFGLFYVCLGYQLLKQQWIEKLLTVSKNPLIWLMVCIATAVAMIVEGLILIQQFAGPIGEYYLFTPLLTVAMLMVALTIKNRYQSSVLSRLGSYSGELYLNHGVLLFFYFTLVGYLGYRSTPEQVSVIANSASFQLLLVPVMLTFNFVLYFQIKKLITWVCGHQNIRQYKDLAMFTGGYWMVFFVAQTAQGEPLFDTSSVINVVIALGVYLVSYLTIMKLLNIDQLAFKSHLFASLIVALCWVGFASFGGFEWLLSLSIQEGAPLARYFSAPFFCFTLFYILATTASILLLSKLTTLLRDR